MSTEFFASIALPRSASRHAKVHASVHLTPKILPDEDGEPLGRSELFPAFTQALGQDLVVTLWNQDGPIDARVVSRIEPDVWARLFPPDLPVRGNPVPYLDDHTWRSFSARSVHDIAKGLHLQSVYADATTPPAPSAHPMSEALASFSRQTTRPYSPGHGYTEFPRRAEDAATERLDEFLERVRWNPRSPDALELPGRDPDHPRPSPENLEFGDGYLNRILVELHRARRFYERPESAEPFAERPTRDSERLKPREGEFHERVAMTGDAPLLMRQLGLVLDVEVADPDRLAQSEYIWASVQVAGRTDWNRPFRLRVQPTGRELVVAAPRGPDWRDALTALGNERLFTVLDLDTDGSALKHERHLWSFPRLTQVEANGDPVNAATPALRSVGFTVSRADDGDATQDQAYRQRVADNQLQAGAAGVDEQAFAESGLLLSTEDVTRGLRVEVWDDRSGGWHSLHRRRSTIFVGGQALVDDAGETAVSNEGFLQASSATQTPGVDKAPLHVHEALFGWDGWSLSVPRPGKRVRNVASPTEKTPAGLARVDERTESPDTGLLADEGERETHPIAFEHGLEPGTLPLLRLGRQYAFRAWAVDLAGNDARGSAGDRGPGGPAVDPAEVEAILEDGHLRALIESRARDRVGDLAPVLDGLRQAGLDMLDRRDRLGRVTRLPYEEVEGRARARGAVLDALRRLHRGNLDLTVPSARLARARHVSGLVAAGVRDDSVPFLSSTRVADARVLAALLSTVVDRDRFGDDPFGETMDALATVTVPLPYLRWDPVPSPAVVARARFTEGESLRVLVVRSHVTQAASLDIVVTAPTEDSERHLAPAKTSQVQAEQHGAFDETVTEGTGVPTAAGIQAALAQSLRENGSFHRLEIADLASPGSTLPTYGDAATTQQVMKVVSAPEPQRREPVDLASLRVGDPLPPGYYVVHDTDDLVLPYLPDPLARGIAVTFPEAGSDRTLAFPFGVEGFTAPFQGGWPELSPFRLVLEGSDALSASVTDRVVTFHLPPGDMQTFTLSTSLDEAQLDLFGLWRTLPQPTRDNHEVREAAADGLIWGLTPGERFLLVHAVPRPLLVPEPTELAADREADSRSATLHGAVRLHGSSTDRLAALASWTDRVDDPALPTPGETTVQAIAFTTPILPVEEVAALGSPGVDTEVHVPGHGRLRVHEARHEFGDTRHHRVSYRMRAFTRFREYFDPAALLPDNDGPRDEAGQLLDDGQSLVGPVVEVDVPSSATPAAPIVHSVIPLFRWTEGQEPEQPLGWRHRRQSGVRIYLERPWFSSGDGELLGVLLAPDGHDTPGGPAPDGTAHPYYSQWGGDPIWLGSQVDRRALSLVQLDALLPVGGPERVLPGRPVTGPVRLPLRTTQDGQGTIGVDVIGYAPAFNEARGLWYVDVAVDPGAVLWPFVRFAVARYQPSSIPGKHLSPPVRCDFAQLPPERTVSVNRTDAHGVRVVVTGPFALRDRPADVRVEGAQLLRRNRLLVARLQSPDPEITGDLGWTTEAVTELVPRGVGDVIGELAWTGELHGPTALAVERPEGLTGWRVTIEEWERFPGDVPPPADAASLGREPLWEHRLVFADEFLV